MNSLSSAATAPRTSIFCRPAGPTSSQTARPDTLRKRTQSWSATSATERGRLRRLRYPGAAKMPARTRPRALATSRLSASFPIRSARSKPSCTRSTIRCVSDTSSCTSGYRVAKRTRLGARSQCPRSPGAVIRTRPRRILELGHRRRRLVHAGERARDRFVVGAACLRQLESARRPLYQPHPEIALERRDRAADRGRRQPGEARRAGEAARLGYADEEAQAVQVDCGHTSNSLFVSMRLVLIEQQPYGAGCERGCSNRAGCRGPRPALPRGAHPLGVARPASDGRPAATDLRPHEVGPDERQLESGTTPLPPEPRGEGAARSGTGAAERRQDAAGACDRDRRPRPPVL